MYQHSQIKVSTGNNFGVLNYARSLLNQLSNFQVAWVYTGFSPLLLWA